MCVCVWVGGGWGGMGGGGGGMGGLPQPNLVLVNLEIKLHEVTRLV